MRTYYLQTLEGAPRLGEVSREEVETYFDVCLEAHSEDPTGGALRIVHALEDVGAQYGADAVPLAFWYVRNMGRTGYYAIDLYNELHPEQVEPEPVEPGEVQQQTEEGNTMTEDEELKYLQFQEKTPTASNVTIETQWVTPGADWVLVDEAEETYCYADEDGGIHYVPKTAEQIAAQKKKSGLGWLIAAAAALFLLG